MAKQLGEFKDMDAGLQASAAAETERQRLAQKAAAEEQARDKYRDKMERQGTIVLDQSGYRDIFHPVSSDEKGEMMDQKSLEANGRSLELLLRDLPSFIERQEVFDATAEKERDPEVEEQLMGYFHRLDGLLRKTIEAIWQARFDDMATQSYGYMNVPSRLPSEQFTPETRDRLESISKTVEEAMQMSLLDQHQKQRFTSYARVLKSAIDKVPA